MSKQMIEPIENLWVGADFLAHGSRWCLIFINGSDKECLAVMIKYDEPHVTGNMICTFRYGELVEYYPRYSQTTGLKSTAQQNINLTKKQDLHVN